jgi:N-acetylmuramoyl-L-alanine amidase
MRSRSSLLLTLLLVLSGPLSAVEEGADIRELLMATGAILEWDEFSRTGLLWGAEESIGFTPGESIAVADFEELLSIQPVAYEQGRLIVPDETFELFRERLGLRGNAARIRPIKAIVIDAGHGGVDPGANRSITVEGRTVLVKEKDLALDMAIRVKAELERLLDGPEIHLSRDTDVFLELGERTDFANSLREEQLDNILFISLHVNASRDQWTDARGVEIYYLPPSQRRQVLDEDASGEFSADLLPILNSVKEDEYTVESVLMGQTVLSTIAEQLPQTPITRGVNVANFFVVREARMPSILIETGFINNREEIVLLNNPEYRRQMSAAIAAGIARYVTDFESIR